MIILFFLAWYIWEVLEEERLYRLGADAPVIKIPIDARQYEREQEYKYQAKKIMAEKAAERKARDPNLLDEETRTYEWIL